MTGPERPDRLTPRQEWIAIGLHLLAVTVLAVVLAVVLTLVVDRGPTHTSRDATITAGLLSPDCPQRCPQDPRSHA